MIPLSFHYIYHRNRMIFYFSVHKLKEKCNEDPSSTIAPQEWCTYFHNLKNVRYDNNFEVDSMNNYIHCNNDVLKLYCFFLNDTLNRNESGRFGALKSDSTQNIFRNACTKSGSLRFSQFSGC
jgi:hypothetical protein